MPAAVKGLRFGEGVAPPEQIGDDALQMEYDDKDWQRFASTLTVRCSPTDDVMTYNRDTISLVPLSYIVGFHPHSGHKAAYVMEQPNGIAD